MTLPLPRHQRPEYKIILLGELGVGKTTFFKRVRDGSEHGEYTCSTVTADSLTHTVRIGDAEVKAHLYDTAGSERFRSLTSNYYFKADAALLMYSVDNSYSFERLQDEIQNADRFIDPDYFVWALIGNKSDLTMEVDARLIEARCEQLHTNLKFFTSAKTGENVLEALEAVIKHVHEHKMLQKCSTVPRGSTDSHIKLITLPFQRKTCCSKQ